MLGAVTQVVQAHVTQASCSHQVGEAGARVVRAVRHAVLPPEDEIVVSVRVTEALAVGRLPDLLGNQRPASVTTEGHLSLLAGRGLRALERHPLVPVPAHRARRGLVAAELHGLPVDRQDAALEVDLCPAQADRLTAPQAVTDCAA
jgi:hypothetical protein